MPKTTPIQLHDGVEVECVVSGDRRPAGGVLLAGAGSPSRVSVVSVAAHDRLTRSKRWSLKLASVDTIAAG
ncbi:MAG: hypothetical protein LC776_08445 [Acidobacteria bacterium]|nr:hypothetical protein [Acidobacteriota bacterium]